MQRGHAEALAPMVQQLMQENKVPFDELSRIAVTIGPGTFTGLRIALSFARGLGVGLKIPVIGFSSLEALALRAKVNNHDELPIWAVIDARRNEAYAQKFDKNAEPLIEPKILSLDEIRDSLSSDPIFWIGSAAELLSRTQDRTGLPAYPDIAQVASITMARLYIGHPPHPLYLRTSDAKPQLMLKSGVKLENLTSLHAELLSEMHSQCFDEGWDAASFASLLANSATLGRLALSSDNQPLAFILANKVADEAEVLTIGVLPQYRNKGLASMLMARFSEELGSLGVARIFLEVSEDNSAARSLYKSAGYIEKARRAAYYASGQDALVLERLC